MSVLDRIGQIVRAEVQALRSTPPKPAESAERQRSRPQTSAARPASTTPRPSLVTDVDRALQVLELQHGATLEQVRARYRALAERYQPQTRSPRDDEASAARLMQSTLTDALELLEEHLLPMPPAAPSTPPTTSIPP